MALQRFTMVRFFFFSIRTYVRLSKALEHRTYIIRTYVIIDTKFIYIIDFRKRIMPVADRFCNIYLSFTVTSKTLKILCTVYEQ